MQKVDNHAHISYFPSPNLPFERKIQEEGALIPSSYKTPSAFPPANT